MSYGRKEIMTKKHPRRKPVTPSSQIRAALRQLWLRSRERGEAVKRQHNTCRCGRKGSVAQGREVKIEVHHIKGIRWDNLIQLIRDQLLQTPDDYICLCDKCHKEQHSAPEKDTEEKS